MHSKEQNFMKMKHTVTETRIRWSGLSGRVGRIGVWDNLSLDKALGWQMKGAAWSPVIQENEERGFLSPVQLQLVKIN